jgi:hypothetical protein
MNTRFTDSTLDRCKDMFEHIARDIATGQPRIDNAIYVPVTAGNVLANAQHTHTLAEVSGEH